MHKPDSKIVVRKPYEAPTIARVHVDPQQELLQATGCAFAAGENATCNASPGV